MRILVLGASGMLGHAVVRVLASSSEHSVVAVSRSLDLRNHFPALSSIESVIGIDAENSDALITLFSRTRPDCVINCIGLVKQYREAEEPLAALPINAMLPHRLANLCRIGGARLIHISTDCVFQGTRGNYSEDDHSDAIDLYGKSKYIGEVGGPDAITLRTSIIGHELGTTHGLVEWILAQEGSIKGYRRAVFSGLPTVELARVIQNHVLPHPELNGLYHLAAEPISKYDLLTLVAKVYGKRIHIEPDDRVCIDRSLNGTRFREATGYQAPTWRALVDLMYANRA